MRYGLRNFTFYTDQVRELTSRAMEQEDPATWLFRNNARTPFFMLEALSRLYAKMGDQRKCSGLNEMFKIIEDRLGGIDYLQFLEDCFQKEKLVSDEYRIYFRIRMSQRVGDFNSLLRDKGWLDESFTRLEKISRKLSRMDWPNRKEEAKGLFDIYESAIRKITGFVRETGFHFDNVEEDVHELRRRLRWLSIYPQAMRGAIGYAPVKSSSAHLRKYLTPEIVTSPYNKLPQEGCPLLLLDKNYFLSLSWLIDRLGKLKDEGLQLTGLSEAIKDVDGKGEEESMLKAEILLPGHRKMRQILDEAEAVTLTYFTEKNIKRLVCGK